MPKYYPINEEAAKRAKDMNSFSDYQPGSATAGYRAMVDEAYAAAERQKARVDPMYHDKIDALVDRYARKLAENLNERNVIDARVPSILISGGGNFPVAKKHKQNAARDRNYGEYAEISKLLDRIRSVGMGGISADDDLAVEKLTKKLEVWSVGGWKVSLCGDDAIAKRMQQRNARKPVSIQCTMIRLTRWWIAMPGNLRKI